MRRNFIKPVIEWTLTPKSPGVPKWVQDVMEKVCIAFPKLKCWISDDFLIELPEGVKAYKVYIVPHENHQGEVVHVNDGKMARCFPSPKMMMNISGTTKDGQDMIGWFGPHGSEILMLEFIVKSFTPRKSTLEEML